MRLIDATFQVNLEFGLIMNSRAEFNQLNADKQFLSQFTLTLKFSWKFNKVYLNRNQCSSGGGGSVCRGFINMSGKFKVSVNSFQFSKGINEAKTLDLRDKINRKRGYNIINKL